MSEADVKRALAWLVMMSDLAREEGEAQQEASCENVIKVIVALRKESDERVP